jgi:hypothetical protein
LAQLIALVTSFKRLVNATMNPVDFRRILDHLRAELFSEFE